MIDVSGVWRVVTRTRLFETLRGRGLRSESNMFTVERGYGRDKGANAEHVARREFTAMSCGGFEVGGDVAAAGSRLGPREMSTQPIRA